MNKELNAHYSNVPSLGIQRSVITDKPTHLTTCNAGDIVPFHWQEVIPGSTYEFSTASVIRSTPAVHATMGNCYADFMYFFVPMRLIWDNWKHFIGEPEKFWAPTGTYRVPQVSFPNGGFSPRSLADHFGLPTLVDNRYNADGSNSVSALPFRAYNLIYNEFFRDENTMNPVLVPTDDTDINGAQLGDASIGVLEKSLHGAEMLKASKPFDLFTSALQSPQRGEEVKLPIGSSAPVTTSSSALTNNVGSFTNTGLVWGTYSNNSLGVPTVNNGRWNLQAYNNPSSGLNTTEGISVSIGSEPQNNFQPLNLVANLDRATAASINDLRIAISIQHIYERLANSGARYREMLYHIWGVADSNPNRDVPYYLGGNRVNVSQQSIVQTSSSTDSDGRISPQGNVAGYTHTTMRDSSFAWSSLEHGLLIGLFCIRQPKIYQNGINRQWLHKDRFDFFWPDLANIGNVGIKNMELFFGSYNTQATGNTNTEIFGYQEPWYEYRYQPSIVTGTFRSNYPDGTLDSWHYADSYDSLPVLTGGFITDNSEVNVNRTLAVNSSLMDQFLVDICISRRQTLAGLPVYSIPGLERI